MAVRGRNYPDDDWFARQLGDGWHKSGDGIYEYVGERRDAREHEDSSAEDVDLPPARDSEQDRESSRPDARR
jgi:hypothetical protein